MPDADRQVGPAWRDRAADLGGRVAIVTGSSRGIGRAIAAAMLDAGARVVLNGRDAATLAVVENDLRSRGEVTAVAADASAGRRTSSACWRRPRAAFGRVDVLVNNAALASPAGRLLEVSPARWDEIIRSNLTSVFLCTRAVAAALVSDGAPGVVINIQLVRRAPRPPRAGGLRRVKGGVEAFTGPPRSELAPFGIRVNAVAPGAIRTDTSGSDPETLARRAAPIPLGRVGEPERSPPRSCSSPRTPRPTSPARRSSSTAG
jgi:NAD(P)-dependent dehydrogenase (short-subunit alcohol dehydrogenase family)